MSLDSAKRQQNLAQNLSAVRQQKLYKTTQFIWFMTAVLEILLALRILLKLVAANPNNAFATFVYNSSSLFLGPFQGLASAPSAEGMVLEISTLIGMLVYALLAWLIIRLFHLIFA